MRISDWSSDVCSSDRAKYALTDTLKVTGGFRYTKVTQDVDIRSANALGCVVPIVVRPDPAICSALFDLSSKKPSYLASIDWQETPDILLYAKTSSSFRGGGFTRSEEHTSELQSLMRNSYA